MTISEGTMSALTVASPGGGALVAPVVCVWANASPVAHSNGRHTADVKTSYHRAPSLLTRVRFRPATSTDFPTTSAPISSLLRSRIMALMFPSLFRSPIRGKCSLLLMGVGL